MILLEVLIQYLNSLTSITTITNLIYSIVSPSITTYTKPYIVLNVISDNADKTATFRDANIQLSIWSKFTAGDIVKVTNLQEILIKAMERDFENLYNYTATRNIDILSFRIEGYRTIKDDESELIQTPFTIRVVYRINS